jgi:EpsD family peptidyl-prolyl cis-trans isomerase
MAASVGRPSGLLCAAAVLLAACGGKSTQQDAPVIASVDGHELTTADLDNSVDPAGTHANLPQPQRAAVDSLIDEHLMAQQALVEGLDRDPAVAQALQNARRRVLAEAFASRLEPPRSPPTPADIEEYYRRNPALFSERRSYSLAIFTVDSAALSDELLEAIGHTTSMNALGQLLGQHSIRFELQQLERATDELPISQLPRYSAASVGDVLVATEANGPTRLIQITGVDPRPVSLEKARPAIQRYLAQLDKTAAVEAYLARARSQARITYYVQGEVSPSRTTQAPAAPVRHATIAQGAPNSDAGRTALN